MKYLIFFFLFLIPTFAFAEGVSSPEVVSLAERMQFFALLVPAALGDSINPCAFGVMIILLSAILKQGGGKRRVLLAGFLFILSIFLSYTAMGIGLYQALATTNSTFYLKLVVGIIGVIIGMANLKDYLWYGKYFHMEVPLSWRPKMNRMIRSVVSPIGAFGIGLVISLFLLPCTSGPYIVILGYLAAESATITLWGYIYILIYNLIFVLPMVIIALLVAYGVFRTDELTEYKELNVEKVHLITGVIMLLIGVYILADILILNV
ncbi:hypothetical protein MK079_00375 [Candidatus Gracilibacteria bacterium]|nr:hypothetical protein [Candidatus Gracilibacteria bacterium]